jgi:hypothetical protein
LAAELFKTTPEELSLLHYITDKSLKDTLVAEAFKTTKNSYLLSYINDESLRITLVTEAFKTTKDTNLLNYISELSRNRLISDEVKETGNADLLRFITNDHLNRVKNRLAIIGFERTQNVDLLGYVISKKQQQSLAAKAFISTGDVKYLEYSGDMISREHFIKVYERTNNESILKFLDDNDIMDIYEKTNDRNVLKHLRDYYNFAKSKINSINVKVDDSVEQKIKAIYNSHDTDASVLLIENSQNDIKPSVMNLIIKLLNQNNDRGLELLALLNKEDIKEHNLIEESIIQYCVENHINTVDGFSQAISTKINYPFDIKTKLPNFYMTKIQNAIRAKLAMFIKQLYNKYGIY